MTINYDKYPSLKIFENDKSVISFLKKVIPEEISNKKKTERILLYLIRKATPNIEIITQTFVDAIERSECSFQKIDRMAFFKENRECGAFVTKKVTFIYVSNEVSSNLFIVDGKEVRAIIEYEFSKETISTIFNKGLNIPAYLTFFVLCLIFKKYAKVEIETYKCGKKKKSDILKDNIKNALPFNVRILDCTWFTTICRTEGFKVRGHFRLQPKKDGNGEWTRELIYINEFEKHGYHRTAKIEKHETDN